MEPLKGSVDFSKFFAWLDHGPPSALQVALQRQIGGTVSHYSSRFVSQEMGLC
jgi:hypothetical protein